MTLEDADFTKNHAFSNIRPTFRSVNLNFPAILPIQREASAARPPLHDVAALDSDG